MVRTGDLWRTGHGSHLQAARFALPASFFNHSLLPQLLIERYKMKSLVGFSLLLLCSITVTAQSPLKPPTETALDRFLRYVRIDTQSKDDQNTVPSTRKEFNLANLLA